MANWIAKQNNGNLTEAEAIGQAQQGAAAAFEYLYKSVLPTRIQPVLRHY